MEFEHVKPMDIEKRSMEIIGQELAEMGISLPADKAHIIKRVIHTSADFDYAQTLTFSEDALERATDALKQGASIITDTKMAWSGINKRALENLGGQAYNFISDEDVAAIAKEKGCTRAAASIDKAANLNGPLIFAVGNAPTALIRLHELITEGKLKPALIIGVPVGFVNVVQAKRINHGNGCALYQWHGAGKAEAMWQRPSAMPYYIILTVAEVQRNHEKDTDDGN